MTDEQVKKIRKLYQKFTASEISKIMNISLGRVKNAIYNHQIRITELEERKRRQLKGLEEGRGWNKGLKIYQGGNTGSFKKGHISKNALYDGAVTLRKRIGRNDQDYFFIRTASMKWKLYHVHLWEIKNGKVPVGHVVRFINGDHQDVRLENLELITRKEHLEKNKPVDVYSNKIKYMLRPMTIAKKYRKSVKQRVIFCEEYPDIIEIEQKQILLKRGIYEAKKQIGTNDR